VTDIGEDRNYFHWERITNGKPEKIDEYATTVTANDVVSRVEVLPEPWFVLAAFNAPHIPYNEPPEALVHHPLTTLCKIDKPACFRATVEAADTEIGRMLSELDPAVLARTTIVFLSDNGAAEEAISLPNDPKRSKGTLFDGGIQVPFIVSGAQVTAPGVVDGFVSILDVFGTLVELAEVPPLTAWDGQPLVSDAVSFAHQLADPTAASLAPRDTHVYSEIIHPNGPPPYNNIERMVRTDDYKMVRDAVDHLYAYAPKALDEGPDLMNGDPPLKVDAGGNLELRTILEAYESLTYEGP
jgi:arylsulfatase A-like enzyme